MSQLRPEIEMKYEHVLIALGANLPSRFGTPVQTLEAAVKELESKDVKVVRRSRWYRSEPVPVSSQDWFINGVISVETGLGPEALLALLHEIEDRFGRERGERNAARVLDLDLIAYGRLVRHGQGGPDVPHPRMHERAFVLLPMVDIAPDWLHPVTGTPLGELVNAIPDNQIAEPLEV
jgi:2-amino-4-hydroxy-6-hydroxymethyldihydropteridine diphosphokinase